MNAEEALYIASALDLNGYALNGVVNNIVIREILLGGGISMELIESYLTSLKNIQGRVA